MNTSEAKERGTLPPDRIMEDLIVKLEEIISDLVKLNKVTLHLLAQHMSVEEFEEKLKKITSGDDVII